jgi:hypothetical protein
MNVCFSYANRSSGSFVQQDHNLGSALEPERKVLNLLTYQKALLIDVKVFHGY